MVLLTKKNLTMLNFVNIVIVNLITHITIGTLFYMKSVTKKNWNIFWKAMILMKKLII